LWRYLKSKHLRVGNKARNTKCDWEGESMNIVFYALAIGTLGTLGTQASAQSQDLNRYEIGAPKQSHKGSLDGVVILDKRTGELWGWSESTAIIYLGKIFPFTGVGSLAHIIQVNPKGDAR
jgi:hypothetical protein